MSATRRSLFRRVVLWLDPGLCVSDEVADEMYQLAMVVHEQTCTQQRERGDAFMRRHGVTGQYCIFGYPVPLRVYEAFYALAGQRGRLRADKRATNDLHVTGPILRTGTDPDPEC